jgi:phage terminase large subunit GpA-like protein
VVTRYSKGFPIREWRKRSGQLRNEPLDCRVYAYAALCSFGTIRWERLRRPKPVEVVEEQVELVEDVPVVIPPPVRRGPRRGSFVKSW